MSSSIAESKQVVQLLRIISNPKGLATLARQPCAFSFYFNLSLVAEPQPMKPTGTGGPAPPHRGLGPWIPVEFDKRQLVAFHAPYSGLHQRSIEMYD